jgi:hypothetical protein
VQTHCFCIKYKQCIYDCFFVLTVDVDIPRVTQDQVSGTVDVNIPRVTQDQVPGTQAQVIPLQETI